MFLNGHGGNSSLLNVACRELRLHHGLHDVPGPSRRSRPTRAGASTADELGMGIHAGLHETSVVLHLRPDLVDLIARRRRNVPEWLAANRHVRFGGERVTSAGWPTTSGPTATSATPPAPPPELGKQLFEASVARLGEQLAEVREFRFR